MKRVTLPGTDLDASVLGLGSVGGRISDAERLRLYEVAFENGITHFDTARAYGVGGAERVLGAFMANKRASVTVTTKLGITPPPNRLFLRVAKGVARSVERLLPSAGGRAKRAAAGHLMAGGRFSVEEAQKSVETSLRELGTDHVDVLLLHECGADDVQSDLLEYLATCVVEGKARYTGIATSPHSTAAILERHLAFPTVVQLANSATEPNLARIPLRGQAVITHSPLSQSFRRIQALLASSIELARRWSDELRADLSDGRTLAALLLSYAVSANPDGVVLFSSTREDHITTNAGIFDDPQPFSDDQLALLAGSEVARDILMGGIGEAGL